MKKLLISVFMCATFAAFAQEPTIKYPLPPYKPKAMIPVPEPTKPAVVPGIQAPPVVAIPPLVEPDYRATNTLPPTSNVAKPVAPGPASIPIPGQSLVVVQTNPKPIAVRKLTKAEAAAVKKAETLKLADAEKMAARSGPTMPLTSTTPIPLPVPVKPTDLSGNTLVRTIQIPVNAKTWDLLGNPTSVANQLIQFALSDVKKTNGGFRKIRVTGHSDQQTTPPVGMQMAKDLAAKVANLLLDNGIPFETVEAYAKGNLAPLQDCQTVPRTKMLECQVSNKRVTLEFFN